MWYDVLKSHKAQLVLTSVVSLGVGGLVGHLVSVKKLEHKYADIAEQEIADAKRFYNELAQRAVRADKPSPAELVARLHAESDSPLVSDAADAILKYQGVSSDEVVKTNVFVGKDYVEVDVDVEETDEDASPPAEVYNEMGVKVDTTKPYLIPEEIWSEAEPGYNQITLSYYAGDDVLADEEEKPIDNVESVIGTKNLERFGEGTEDANTMFIRNDQLKLDFEVVRSDGKYIHEVLGLQHDDQRQYGRPRKFRHADE